MCFSVEIAQSKNVDALKDMIKKWKDTFDTTDSDPLDLSKVRVVDLVH